MKGLLMKDWEATKKNGKFVLLSMLWIVVSMLIFILLMDKGKVTDINIYVGVIAGVMSMIPFSLIMAVFSADQSSHWNQFGLTLPVKPYEMVLSKYILTLVLVLFFGIINFGVVQLISVLTYAPFGGQTFDVVLGMGLAALLVASLFFPMMYWLGPNKGRTLLILFALIPLLVSLFGDAIKSWNVDWLLLWRFTPLLVLLIYLLSFVLSYALFKRKSF